MRYTLAAGGAIITAYGLHVFLSSPNIFVGFGAVLMTGAAVAIALDLLGAWPHWFA